MTARLTVVPSVRWWRPLAVIVTLVLALSIGCSDAKMDQCRDLISEGNRAQSLFSNLDKIALNPDELNRRATAVDESVKRLRALSIHDAPLRAFRDRYASGLESSSQGMRDLARHAGEPRNPSDYNRVADRLDGVSATEAKLVGEVNAYCSK